MLLCARGTTINAASSGPMADPVLPPTWNSDWANPCARRRRCVPPAMSSGGNTDEPTPTSAAANKIVGFRGTLACLPPQRRGCELVLGKEALPLGWH